MTADHPVVCCDLDGVVWRGDEPVPGAGAAISALRHAGFRVVFVSNNSSQPVHEVATKLGAAGAPTSTDDVVTSAVSAATLLASTLHRGAPVLACAGPGVLEALEAAGLRPVTRPPASAVVVGFHRGFDFDELDRASAAVRDGARFVATNLDATYPVPGGMIPGSGAIAAAVATASGRAPEVAGKPERPMVDLIRKRFGSAGVVVGDRVSTDGALAAALDWPFALVLSGVTQRDARPGGEAIPQPRPPFVADDLASLVPKLVEVTSAG